MSPSLTHFSSSDSGSSQPNTPLEFENIIEEHHKVPHFADALPHSTDALPSSADAQPHFADAQLYPADTSSSLVYPNLPQISTMAPRDRSRGRDVHIYDAKDRTIVLGGLILTNGITSTNFYFMVGIIFLFTTDFELQDEGNTKIKRNDDPLRPGGYYINATGKFLYRLYRLSFLAN
jgi:hypothetical protein